MTTTTTKLPIRTLLQNINLKLAGLCLQEGVDTIRIDSAGKERIAHAHANELQFRVSEKVGEGECKIHVLYWNVYLSVGNSTAKVERVS